MNYTLEGLEEAQAAIDEETMPEFDFEAAKPDITDEEKKKVAELQTVEEPVEYKYSSIGRKLPVGRDGTWTRKSKLWRPWEIPEDYRKQHP